MEGCRCKGEQQREDRRFNKKQYKFLKECAKEGTEGIKKWNEKRMNNPGEEILLEDEEALFDNWYLQKVNLRSAHLRGAQFWGTKLQGADFTNAHLECADLREAYLRGAILFKTHFEETVLWSSHLEEANLKEVHLEGANLQGAYLEGAFINGAHLEGANFHLVHVDSSTLIWACKVDHNTNFNGVALDTAQIDPGMKQLLEYNIRRKNWEEWYPKHIFLRWPVRWFWSVSNYGLSTWRIIGWFLMLSLFFAAVYSNIACWYPQGIVSNLTVEPHIPLWHYFILLLLRPIYFSVVTMTTLGFGDMYANSQSIWGHLLLTIQVILGYVLLGALVTRFAVLFTAGGPAGTFSKENKK